MSIDALLKKLQNPGPALDEVGKALQASTQARIKTTKTSPDGMLFAPWSYATMKARDREGSTSGGVLFRTGRLLNSIQYQVQGTSVVVGSDSTAPYARYLQYGTGKMPARPFIGFSDQDLQMIRTVLQKHLKTP